MNRTVRRPLLRYFGGKWFLGKWILDHCPPHESYTVFTDSYGGAGSVLLRKPRSYAEVYNDLDQELVNLFRVAREDGEVLLRSLELTPYARAEFELSYIPCDDPVEQARRTIVRSYMGFGSTLTRLTVGGRLMRTGFRDYSKKNRGSIPAQDWKTYPEALYAIIERLRGVIIENAPAMTILKKHDGPNTLHYVDPPYVHSTRGRSDGYRHEMTDQNHAELAALLRSLKGKVILSGYRCEIYDRLFADWNCFTRPAMADGARKRHECLWLNYDLKGKPSPIALSG